MSSQLLMTALLPVQITCSLIKATGHSLQLLWLPPSQTASPLSQAAAAASSAVRPLCRVDSSPRAADRCLPVQAYVFRGVGVDVAMHQGAALRSR